MKSVHLGARARRRLRALRAMSLDATASLLGRPWHALGMIAGVLLGVASVLAAVVIADTQQAQIDIRFDLQRSDRVILRADSAPRSGFPVSSLRLLSQLEPVNSVGEFSIWSDSVRISRSVAFSSVQAPVIVADTGGLAASGTTVVVGSSALLDATDKRVAWVGRSLAARLGVAPYSGSAPSDAEVVVGGRSFSVAGIIGNSEGFDYVNSSVVLSRGSAVTLPPSHENNIRLLIRVRPGAAAAVAGYALRAVDPTYAMGLVDVTPPDGAQLLQDVGGDLKRVGAALGLFMGLVGMVTIANTLMLSVNSRLRELGLRSAMGWTRTRIALLILTESGFSGMVAGVLGAAAGLASASAWCWAHGWALVVAPALAPMVIACGVGASLLGGVVPALKAASIAPLEAMRS